MLRTDGPEMPGSGEVAQGRWRTALASTEGRVLVTGLLLAMLYLAVIGLTLRWSAGSFHRLLAMTGTHLVLGRAAGLTGGLGTVSAIGGGTGAGGLFDTQLVSSQVAPSTAAATVRYLITTRTSLADSPRR